MNKRFQRKGHKKKSKVPKGFDSKFEYDLSKILKGCNYHTEKVEYTSFHTYEPDFLPKNNNTILIEAKGFLRAGESKKYIDVRDSNPDKEIVFIFQNPTTPMNKARVRKKCGTKRTHGEWATENGFKWYTINTIPKEWKK